MATKCLWEEGAPLDGGLLLRANEEENDHLDIPDLLVVGEQQRLADDGLLPCFLLPSSSRRCRPAAHSPLTCCSGWPMRPPGGGWMSKQCDVGEGEGYCRPTAAAAAGEERREEKATAAEGG